MKQQIARGPGGIILLTDSVTRIEPEDAGSLVVSASHGGVSSAGFALEVPLTLVVFNDAGVGKDGAGIAALDVLQSNDIASATVAHASARIGDAQDTWDCGVISHVNAKARALGLAPGQALKPALLGMIGS